MANSYVLWPSNNRNSNINNRNNFNKKNRNLVEKVNTLLSYIITFGVCFIVATQLIYYKIYEAILSIFSIFNGGQVTEFMTTIIDKMQENWQGLVLIFIPFIILILLKIFKIVEFRKKSFDYYRTVFNK